LQINKYILTYKQACKAGAGQVGTKALNTACCNEYGFMIPNGIILTFQAFRAYLNGENLERLFSTIEEHFANSQSVIVRSSAFEEDTEKLSYAGQYLSLICLNKATEIRKACEACWESYSSSHVKSYHRAIKGSLPLKQNGMGLLIQKVVNATSAGVCFTIDPLKDQKDVFIIDAVHGLGEALVASEVVADHYEFDIKEGNIISSITGKQTHWRNPECPQEISPLPQELLKKSVLTQLQIEKVAHTAHKTVKLFGSHQDIEWAYEGDKLFLIQIRSITTSSKNEKFELWTLDDITPDAVTPLTWSIVKDAINNGFRTVSHRLCFPNVPATFFKIFDSKVYFNQTAYQSLLTINRKKPRILKVALNYLSLLSSLKKDVTRLEDTFWKDLIIPSVADRASAIRRLKICLDKYMAIHIRVSVLMDLGFIFIRRIIKKHISEDKTNTLVDGLVTGLKEIESTASGEALWELACLIKDNKELTETILSSQDQPVPTILQTWGGIYGEKWQQFLNQYGHCSMKEFEIYYPRWAEDPSFIIAILKQYIFKGKNIDVETNEKIRTKKRIESERMLLKSIPLIYYLPLKFYINHVQQCSIWRESIKQKLVRITAEIRKQVLAFADKYKIDPLDNVFFLTLEEICQIKGNSILPQLLGIMEKRKGNWEKWERQNPFREIRVYSDNHQIKIPYIVRTDNHLSGMPLSSGKYIGPARIIMNPTHMDSFNLGDILVTRSTNPSWTPLFALAGAIVTDMGNYLSHGAIVARELGIPAVGNLQDATIRIADGQIIEVDGDSGTVKL
jgi:pyruvate,water dikinase